MGFFCQTGLQAYFQMFHDSFLAIMFLFQPHPRLSKETHCLKMMETRLGIVSQRRLVKEKHRLQLLEQELKAASPENLLKRGYSITLKKDKAVIDASVLQPGDELTTRFAKGEIKSIVTKK